MPYKIIVAVDDNYGIGKNNNLPWRCKEDLRHFSKTTKGNGNNAVIMGRKTWDSLNHNPLPKRDNYILSRSFLDIRNTSNKTFAFTDIDKLLHVCSNKNYDDIWIIGGSEIYTLFLKKNMVSEIHITNISGNYNCDTVLHMDFHMWKIKKPSMLLTKPDMVPKASYQIWIPC